MNNRAFLSPPLILALVMIVAVLTAVTILLAPIGTGTKILIHGTAQHEGGEEYSIQYNTADQEKDTWLLNTEQPGLWLWDDTQDLKVVLKIDGQEVSSKRITSGTFFAEPVDFVIIGRHIPPGFHDGDLEVYALVGGFMGIGATEVFKDSDSFTITVKDYGNN